MDILAQLGVAGGALVVVLILGTRFLKMVNAHATTLVNKHLETLDTFSNTQRTMVTSLEAIQKDVADLRRAG